MFYDNLVVFPLLVAILRFSYFFFQSSGFIELNSVFVGLRQSPKKALYFYLLILNIPDIPQQFQELVCIFLHSLLSHYQLMEFFDFIIIVLVREVLLLEIFMELFPDILPFTYILYLPEVFPPNRRSSCQTENGYSSFHISRIILDLEIFSYSQKPSFILLTSLYLTIEGRRLCLPEFIS